MGCGVIGAALVPVPVCCWQAVQVGGVICCGRGVLAWSSWQRRQHPARAGLLIRQAGQAGRWEGGAKEKGQGGGAWCAAALAFCLHWRCDLLRRVRPGAYRGRRGSAPCSGAGVLALALIRVQRFRLHLIRLHGLRWRCSIRCVFVPPPEGSDSLPNG